MAFQLWQLQLHKAYQSDRPEKWPIVSDGLGYYLYLPATFIFQDWSYDFVPEGISGGNDFFNIRSPKTGHRLNKYPIGVSILQSPFFAIGHLSAWISGSPQDGFSYPYRFWLIIGAFFYLLLGLIFIRKFLAFFFSENTIALILLCLALGTNLFYYSLHEGLMSHVYSFCFMAIACYYTVLWHREAKLKQMLALAAACGMIFLLRPPNILFLSFFLLWGLGEKGFGAKKKKHFWENRFQLLWGMLLGGGIIFLQLCSWKSLAGSWFIFTYEGEGFLWAHPAITDVLWSYRKGWWIYTPLALFMCLGLFRLRKQIPAASIALPVFFILNFYLVSSWWSWWYGGGFGMRALIDVMAPLSLALGSFAIFIRKKGIPKWVLGFFIGFFIILNVFQTYQMKRGYIHHDSMTKEAYWAIFGKADIKGDEREVLKKLYKAPSFERMEGEGSKVR